MWNLIKAQNYQLKRDRATRYMWVIFLGSLVVIFLEYLRNNPLSDLTGSNTAVVMSEPNVMIPGIFVILLTARIVGWDYTDKTLNYELMAGHSRRAVYWSRVWVSLVCVMVGCAIFLFLPLLFFGLINGWGHSADLAKILFRYGLSLLPLFRLMGECVLLTVLLKNCYMAMIIGYMLFEAGMVLMMVLEPLVDFDFTTQLSVTNLYSLVYVDYCRFQYIDGEDVVVYETALESGLITGTIGVSLVVGIACLWLGYLYFKKSDMN